MKNNLEDNKMDFHYGIQVRMDVRQTKPKMMETEDLDGNIFTTNSSVQVGIEVDNPEDIEIRFKDNEKVQKEVAFILGKAFEEV